MVKRLFKTSAYSMLFLSALISSNSLQAMGDLPLEMVEQILSLADKPGTTRLVCKQWNALVDEKSENNFVRTPQHSIKTYTNQELLRILTVKKDHVLTLCKVLDPFEPKNSLLSIERIARFLPKFQTLQRWIAQIAQEHTFDRKKLADLVRNPSKHESLKCHLAATRLLMLNGDPEANTRLKQFYYSLPQKDRPSWAMYADGIEFMYMVLKVQRVKPSTPMP